MPDLDSLDRDLRTLAAQSASLARAVPAAEVRARGSRRRASRHAVVAALTVVLVVAGGVLLLGDGAGKRRTAPPAESTTAAPQIPASVLPEILEYDQPKSDRRFVREAVGKEVGAQAVSVCQRDSLASLGARDVLVGGYGWQMELGPGESVDPTRPGPTATVAVAEFADQGDGSAAYETVSDWVRTCLDRRVRTFSEVDQPSGAGWTAVVVYDAPPEFSSEGDNSTFDPTAVGLSRDGRHLVLISMPMLGQDYNALPEEASITIALRTVLDSVAANS